MSYDTLDLEYLVEHYDEDAGVGHIRPLMEEIDTDHFIENCYEANGQYFSYDAATWSAEEDCFVADGHTFQLKDFVPCENRGMCGWCPCNIEEKREQD